MTKQFHEVANIFPMMQADELDELKRDIATNGLKEPVWLHPDGSIIDGRNRYLACKDVGIIPEYRTWNGKGSLVSFVVSLNLHRRHLSSSQKAAVAVELLPMLEAEAKERQIRKPKNSVVEIFPQQNSDQRKSRDQAAKLTGTNGRYVSDVKKIKADKPEVFEQILQGDLTITDAKRQIKEEKREIIRQDNRKLVENTAPIESHANGERYQTIVIDPPWDWGDEGDKDQFGRAKPTYNTMGIDELLNLPVGDLVQANAHVYLWITNRSLPKGFALLEKWGFRYITCVTWCKPHFGMGNYFRGSTEQILFGVRGSLPLLQRNVGTWFNAKRGDKHSEKPDEFYKMVEACSPGPWLEMFSRKDRPGWDTWGAEV